MPDQYVTTAPSTRLGEAGLQNLVRAGLVVGFASLLVLSYTQNVNWDEFYFLSHVHAHIDGRLDRPMQTFFVHAFTWLRHVPGHEMAQIFAARLIMVGLLATTLFSIYLIARKFSDHRSGLIAALAFLSSGFVLPYGASFRADPIAAALLCGAAALILTTRLSVLQIVLAALLAALALLTTIKSALFLPAFLGCLYLRAREPGMALRITAIGLLGLGLTAILYLWHAAGVTIAPGNDAATNAREAASTTLFGDGIFPRHEETLLWALLSLAPLALAVTGIVTSSDRRVQIALIAFAAPIAVVLFYRNAFPYFFPFVTPLVMIAVGVGAARLRGSILLHGLVIIMLVSGAAQALISLREGTKTQRATIAEVHRLFDQPVKYIDHNGMIASFPRVGFFMSTWGLKSYHAAGVPVFGDLIAREKPPLLIANRWALRRALIDDQVIEDPKLLMPQDRQVLRETYIHYSGAIWLAGREVSLGSTKVAVKMPFAGRYRLEAASPVEINGARAAPGDVLSLDDGPIVLDGSPGTVRLIWDTGVAPISTPLGDEALYAEFWNIL